MTASIEFSSFKDPDAAVISENGIYKRKFSENYIPVYREFMSSGLYYELVNENLIIPHKESENFSKDYTIIPEQVFISYPWEWCFSQLKDAALVTLKIQKIALKYGFTLKDANCFNIQFYKNRPVLIDTSSFERYYEGGGWCAYRQFCMSFICPLALMAYKDFRLNSLFLSNMDGIPLDLASKLLPLKTYFDLGLLFHVHFHSGMSQKYSQKKDVNFAFMSKKQLENIVTSLEDTVRKINLPSVKSEWSGYYDNTNYSESSFEEKKSIVKNYMESVNPHKVYDFGSNTGVFSKIFSQNNIEVKAFDLDHQAVEKLYNESKNLDDKNLSVFIQNLAMPSPAAGWAANERKTLLSRTNNVDLILALALIHHLRITNNIPLDYIAQYFTKFSKYLIIEFIDKNDSQIQFMLANRKDVFFDYNQDSFEQIFSKHYSILKKNPIKDTKRTLYLMERKD